MAAQERKIFAMHFLDFLFDRRQIIVSATIAVAEKDKALFMRVRSPVFP
ncbi:hypothetical protein ACFSHT_32505 [Paraburkholderia silviterrae]|nr:hypothetical protein [Paraburkholderia silviterrae]